MEPEYQLPISNKVENDVDPDLLSDLVQLAASVPGRGSSEVTLLSHRSNRVLVRVGSVVVKAHAASTQADELNARLELLLHAPLNEIFLPPLQAKAWPVRGHLLATLWPAGVALDENLDHAPWIEAAQLLARLHKSPWKAGLPQCRALAKVKSVLSQLEGFSDDTVKAIQAAADTLDFSSDPSATGRTTLVHGDWHFGQLLAFAESGKKTFRLIDPDDLGLGDPAWDLARPAAFFAAGLIPPAVWESFMSSYRAAGGPALPQKGDPWITLDQPARALTVQCAGSAVLRSRRYQRPLAEAEEQLVDTCRRIASMTLQNGVKIPHKDG